MNVEELLNILNNSKFNHLELSMKDISIKMDKDITSNYKSTEPNELTQETSITSSSNNNDKGKECDSNIYELVSPIVGTLYKSSGPDVEPFVNVGSKVKKGDILCIIEAMKLMNEIRSEVDGEILEILAEDSQMLEYNQIILRIKVT